MKHMIVLALLLASASALVPPVHAHTSEEVKKVCPLCKTEFKTRVDTSGYQSSTRLDLKPLGRIAAPSRVPVCPKCRFVLYAEDVSNEDMQRCREIIQTKEYKSSSARASYFLLGLLYEGLGRDSRVIGHVFLKASWQEERDADQLKQDLERSLKHFEAYLKSEEEGKNRDGEKAENQQTAQKDGEKAKDRQTAQIVKGEILRRLGRFDDAKEHFAMLQGKKEFQGAFFVKLIRYEITLCGNEDSRPHDIKEMR